MATQRGVICTACGASTPLPEDLRVPTFPCCYCGATLDTAALAGTAAVSADALMGHMVGAMADPATAIANANANAPKFDGGSRDSRVMPCRACGVPLAVPLDVSRNQVTCEGCGQTHAVNLYISDKERFDLDMERQVAGNEALKRVLAEGVPCGRCGGANPVPREGLVQIVCAFCGATILLANHVDETALARHRLKQGVFGLRDQVMSQQAERDRKLKRTFAVVFTVLFVGFIVANLIMTR